MSASARLTAVPGPDDHVVDDRALDTGLHLLGAAIPAPAAAVAGVAELVTSTDFADPQHGNIWQTVAALAAEGIDPTAPLVMARLTESGHAGELLRKRLLDAATCPAVPEALPQYAHAVLSGALRRAIAGYGTSLAETAEHAAAGDLWAAVLDGGKRIRAIHTRLTKLRGDQ